MCQATVAVRATCPFRERVCDGRSQHEKNASQKSDDEQRPTDPKAHLAQGVEGDEPPLEDKGARRRAPAQDGGGTCTPSIETAHFGFKEMGIERSFQTLLKVNQKDGFDCPSCAWPDPDGHRKMAEFCENGAKAVASEATTKRLTPEVFAGHPISEMLKQRDVWLDELGRITHPMLRRKGSDHYEPISWDDAFDLIGRRAAVAGVARRGVVLHLGPRQQRGGLPVRALRPAVRHEQPARLLQHVPRIERSRPERSRSASARRPCRIEDFEHADAIFVIGQNPGTNHPRMLTELQKAARNGCKIVSVNPLIETGPDPLQESARAAAHARAAARRWPASSCRCASTAMWPLLKGIMKEMLEEDERTGGKVLAHDFIEQHTEGLRGIRRTTSARRAGTASSNRAACRAI